MTDTVHIADRQPGIIEGRLDHGDLEGAAVQVELAGGRREIGDAHDRGLSSQRISHLSPSDGRTVFDSDGSAVRGVDHGSWLA